MGYVDALIKNMDSDNFHFKFIMYFCERIPCQSYEYDQNRVALVFETFTFAVGCTLGLPANKLSDAKKMFYLNGLLKSSTTCATKRRLLNDTRAIL
mgnify:CR=1 FL=1